MPLWQIYHENWLREVWNTSLVWANVLSDLVLFTAYSIIPILIMIYVQRTRVDHPESIRARTDRAGLRGPGAVTMLYLYLAFMATAGLTHVLSSGVIVWPDKQITGLIRIISAGAGIGTAICLPILLLLILRARRDSGLSREDARSGKAVTEDVAAPLEAAGQRLEAAVLTVEAERLAALAKAKTLESRVSERTLELADVYRTAQENFEAAEREKKSYIALCESMPSICWTARADGAVDYYNSQWYDYVGNPGRETLGWGWSAVMHPDDLDNVVRTWAASVATGEPFKCKYRMRSATGEYRWFLGTGIAAKTPQGQVLRWCGTCTDIKAVTGAREGSGDEGHLPREVDAAAEKAALLLTTAAKTAQDLLDVAAKTARMQVEETLTVSHDAIVDAEVVLGAAGISARLVLDAAEKAAKESDRPAKHGSAADDVPGRGAAEGKSDV